MRFRTKVGNGSRHAGMTKGFVRSGTGAEHDA